jgi:UDP-glucose-4-epimerase GalE
MSILVTGGAGYIGSHTVRRLTALGHEVVVLDTMEYGHRSAVIEAELVEGNIADLDLVVDLCNRRDITQVVHFAAYKSVGESMEQPSRYWLNNVTGTVKLVEAMLTAGVNDIVFSSSCSVYGTPVVVPVTEDAPIQPESIYAESKAMTERILRWYGISHGLRSVSLRYFNAAGASADSRIGEDWRQSLNLIPLVMKATLGRRPPVQVFGNDYPTPDGTCIRDYIHVDDLADAHVKSLDYLAGGGQSTAVNVGTGTGSSVMEVIDATERITGQSVPWEIAARRAGDPVATFADPTMAAQLLNWQPAHGLDDIVASAWQWHSTHLDGYDESPSP